ncbi:MAG: trigger factor [Alphaproteobacteria bacterium]|nr:MAG: trigger factor [Rickettsiaceae bacterium 4572_127]
MKLKSKKVKKLHHSLTFVLENSSYDKLANAEYLELQKKVKIKGFRKGKAPISQIEAMYSEQTYYRIINKLAEKSMKFYYETEKVRPASQPKIDLKKEKKEIILTAELDALPEIKEVNFSKIKLEKQIYSVDEKDISKSLENLAESRRETHKIKETRPLKKGDIAVIDFEGILDGKPFEGGKAERHFLELGSKTFIPGFEEKLIGKEVGKTELDLEFPKEYGSEKLAGKKVVFKVNVREIREKVLPKIDDKFAKELKLKDLEDLKSTIKKELEKQNETKSKQDLKDKLLDALADKTKMDLPISLIEEEIKVLSKDSNEKEKVIRKKAEQRVKLGLLLGDLGKKFEIKISQQELKQNLFQQAMMSRHPNPQQLLKDFDKNPNQFSGLYAMMFEDKVITKLLEKITIKEKIVKKK